MSKRKKKARKKALRAAVRRALAKSAGPAFVTKAARPGVVTKAAARMARQTAGMVLCSQGRHWNRPGGNLCAECLELMPGVRVPPMEWIGKSAFATGFWEREMARSPDPSVRELYNRMRYGEGGAA